MDRNSNGTFAKGHRGFRPKGSRNRFTVAMMDELMRGNDGQLDFHPMQEAKTLYRTTEDEKIKLGLLKELLSFGNDKQFVEVEQKESEEISDDVMKDLYEQLKAMYEPA